MVAKSMRCLLFGLITFVPGPSFAEYLEINKDLLNDSDSTIYAIGKCDFSEDEAVHITMTASLQAPLDGNSTDNIAATVKGNPIAFPLAVPPHVQYKFSAQWHNGSSGNIRDYCLVQTYPVQ
ncbi:hypothetical protein [Phyllobacterium sp. SB3]|uniref:hypothetical protein n=1 Tax=Phyllobacterium sp. SB3 TaxID=3156073 RepID=UPI0032AFB575